MAAINHYNSWNIFRDQYMELEGHIKTWVALNAGACTYQSFTFDNEGNILIRVLTWSWEDSGHTDIRVPLESVLPHVY